MTVHPPVTRSGAQRAARHELAKGIYHRSSKPLVQRVLDAIGRFIDRLLGHAAGHSPSGNAGVLALVAILAVVVIVVIWRVGVPRRAAAAGTVLADGKPVAAADHRLRSEQAAAAGRWNTAVVERMRAIARELEESGIVEPRAGRTASELAEETARLVPAAAEGMRGCAQIFNDVAYGGATADSAQLETLVATDDLIRTSPRSRVVSQ